MKLRRRTREGLAILALAMVLGYFSWDIWAWLKIAGEATGPKTQEEVSATIRNYGLIAFGIVGFILTIIRLRYIKRQHILDKRSALFDRYQKSSEMMGNPSVALRQAGIHSVFQIAQEDPVAFYDLVTNLFCTFLREASDDQRKEAGQKEKYPIPVSAKTPSWPPVRADMIEALHRLSTLRTNIPKAIRYKNKLKIVLDLKQLFVPGIRLEDISFINCDLTDAVFTDTDQVNLRFDQCCLSNAEFNRAQMRKCEFHNCNATIIHFHWTAFFSSRIVDGTYGVIDAPYSLGENFNISADVEEFKTRPAAENEDGMPKFPQYSNSGSYWVARDVVTESENIAEMKASLRSDQTALKTLVSGGNKVDG